LFCDIIYPLKAVFYVTNKVMSEIWKDIPWYKWLYQVSNKGNIKSFWTSRGMYSKPKILKGSKVTVYSMVLLYKNKITKRHSIHRLVAQAFLGLDIRNTKILVCHRKEDLNQRWMLYNGLDNIFLWNHQDNANDMIQKWRNNPFYKWKFGKDHNTTKEVLQYDLEWNFIKKWYWGYEVKRSLWISSQSICKVCKWKRPTAWWFKWKYLN